MHRDISWTINNRQLSRHTDRQTGTQTDSQAGLQVDTQPKCTCVFTTPPPFLVVRPKKKNNSCVCYTSVIKYYISYAPKGRNTYIFFSRTTTRGGGVGVKPPEQLRKRLFFYDIKINVQTS